MDTVLENLSFFGSGLLLTLSLAISSVLLGGILGFALVVLGRLNHPFAFLVSAYVYVIRSTPLLVQIYLVYYGAGQVEALRSSILWVVFGDAYFCAIFALSINTAAYSCEILRGGLESVPRGYIDAAQALGLSKPVVFLTIQLPLAIRQALPGFGNEAILLIKGTALASTITLYELTGVARLIVAQTYEVYEVFAFVGGIYLLLCWLVATCVKLLEDWLKEPK